MSKLAEKPFIWRDDKLINAPELMTRFAAQMLAKRIQAYWRKRGHTVTCRVEQMQGERVDGHGSIFCVRSSLVNGMPPK